MDKSKRSLAKVLGVFGAGATIWKTPVVDAVVLPVHAQTSSCEGVNCDLRVSGPAGLALAFTNGQVLAGGDSDPCDGLQGVATINSDGSFEISAPCGDPGPIQVRVVGTIDPGCGSVSGTFDGFDFLWYVSSG